MQKQQSDTISQGLGRRRTASTLDVCLFFRRSGFQRTPRSCACTRSKVTRVLLRRLAMMSGSCEVHAQRRG